MSGFAFVTLLVNLAFYGKLQFNPRAFVLTVAVGAAALFGAWFIGKSGGTYVKLHSDISYLSMGLPKDIQSLSGSRKPRPGRFRMKAFQRSFQRIPPTASCSDISCRRIPITLPNT